MQVRDLAQLKLSEKFLLRDSTYDSGIKWRLYPEICEQLSNSVHGIRHFAHA